MNALAVFHDQGSDHWANRWLKPGFKHVFACLQLREYWVRVDGMDGVPKVEVLAGPQYDLAAFYRKLGYVVAEFEAPQLPPRLPFVTANCVGLVKLVLGIRAPFVWTPWQLHQHLKGVPAMRFALPGKSVFDPPSPPDPAPPPAQPKAPAVEAAGDTRRQSELMRRGRRASILTSGRGVQDELGTVNRPQARAAQVLGGVGGA